MSGQGLRGGRIGRCLALAALAPMAFVSPAMAQSAPSPPVAASPIDPAPAVSLPPPVVIPALTAVQVLTALKVLQAADLHGLQPKVYIRQAIPASGDLTPAQQTALAEAIVRYAHDVHIGRMDTEAFPANWAVRPAAYDPKPDLVKALAEDRLQAWLDSLAPRYAGYTALKRGLARYREIAAVGGWKPLSAGKPMGLASTDPRASRRCAPGWRLRIRKSSPRAAPSSTSHCGTRCNAPSAGSACGQTAWSVGTCSPTSTSRWASASCRSSPIWSAGGGFPR